MQLGMQMDWIWQVRGIAYAISVYIHQSRYRYETQMTRRRKLISLRIKIGYEGNKY